MTESDVKSRSLRTLAQNLLFDVLLAVIVVVLPAVQGDAPNWNLVFASALKTAAATALAGVQRVLELRRPV